MIKVKASIKLYEGENVRKTPFTTGYRPLFNFITDVKTSGQISLIKHDKFFPGEQGSVDIEFINN
ncbi:translation elongation factor EF-Tu-like GTPase [Mucilaginibacter sp. 3215]